ncbi:hypothetical protein C8A00DRAFT_34849 [Chaetomidium leptoderma]|uniref:Uncharacterized protein n=1 Tax=Chaetomidium leptoderma TaxID=669021 RepID=A0AAN6VLB5_9PEZI|nr:hypothetical protein C8A00DRAFT_34849 [Chaetomidium leptoderma]
MAEIVSHMFAPEYAAAALEAPTRATPERNDLRLLADFGASTVADKENSLDMAAGHWKVIYGAEGRGPIDAYEEDTWGRTVILHDFTLSSSVGFGTQSS